MANDYYKRQHSYDPLTRARGEEVREDLDFIQKGFEKLPPPNGEGTGFSDAFEVEKASRDKQPMQRAQVEPRLSHLEQQFDSLFVADTIYTWSAPVAKGGETELTPPYQCTHAQIFINGIMQDAGRDAFTIADNKIKLSEPLEEGDEVQCLIGANGIMPGYVKSAEDARDASREAQQQSEQAEADSKAAQQLSEQARDASRQAQQLAEQAQQASEEFSQQSEQHKQGSHTARALSQQAQQLSEQAQRLAEQAQAAAEQAMFNSQTAKTAAEAARDRAIAAEQMCLTATGKAESAERAATLKAAQSLAAFDLSKQYMARSEEWSNESKSHEIAAKEARQHSEQSAADADDSRIKAGNSEQRAVIAENKSLEAQTAAEAARDRGITAETSSATSAGASEQARDKSVKAKEQSAASAAASATSATGSEQAKVASEKAQQKAEAAQAAAEEVVGQVPDDLPAQLIGFATKLIRTQTVISRNHCFR